MGMFFDTLKAIGIILLVCLIIAGGRTLLHGNESSEPVVNEYEILSVYQYTETITNNFGCVIDTEIKYCFTYIDEDGALRQIKDFKHTEYGIHKLHVGKENKYIEKGSEKHLYLTKETFNNLSKGD